MHSTLSRRGFLTTLSSAGIAGLTGTPGAFAQEAPPEITTIRLAKNQSLCIGPQYVAEDLLRTEGFTTVRYLTTDGGAGQARMLAQGEIDFTLHFSPLLLIPIDAGGKITIIAGVHVGCFELFATDRIRTIADLKGKTVGIPDLGASPTYSCRPWQPMSGLTRPRISIGSPVRLSRRGSFSPRARSRRFSVFRRTHRNCALERSATWSSTVRSTAPGHSTFAACWAETEISSAGIRLRPSACCAPSSRRPTSVSAIRRLWRGA